MDMNAIGSHIRHSAGIVSECRMLLAHGKMLTKDGHLSSWERCFIAARGSCHAMPCHGCNVEVECKGGVEVSRWSKGRMSDTMTAGEECQVGCESIVTDETCASLRQISTSRAQRAESVCERRERHKGI
jgi:hypothetical protein